VTFIDEHQGRFGGVEPICRVLTEHGLQIAPSGYYAARKRGRSARDQRDEELLAEIGGVYASNYDAYGADKMWRELHRQGHRVARCTVERLMRRAGLVGVSRGKRVRTTVADPGHERAADRVKRDFTAPAANRTWVADFTYVAAWCGTVYVAFVVDVYSRAIVGWAASTNKRTPLVLNALDMALWRRDRAGRTVQRGLIHHSDAGSQPGFNRSSQHLECGGVDGPAGGVDEGVDGQVADEVAGEAGASARCRAAVLA
jgi:putative transposase